MVRTLKQLIVMLAAVVAVGLAIHGCRMALDQGTQSSLERHQLLFQAATRYGTLKVLQKNPALAPDVARIAGETANMLENEGLLVMPLDVLETTVRGKIRWDRLTPEEDALVNALIASVMLELRSAEAAYADPGPVMDAIQKEQNEVANRQVLYYAAVVLRWIEQAALERHMAR